MSGATSVAPVPSPDTDQDSQTVVPSALSSLSSHTIAIVPDAGLNPTLGEDDTRAPGPQNDTYPALLENEPAVPIFEPIANGWCFVAHSAIMREIREMVDLVAQTNLPVLILGESGTGKEVIVRLIHALSLRADRPLLRVNCAALPAELLESELFGYEAGAFTGATKAKAGKFEACNQGTLVLDEIAEMPLALQAKLLHVLQDGEFFRLGSPSSVQVDVRVLAATNVDITQALKAKKFREDLYYRLSPFTIQLPPLRDRKEDIPWLMHHLMKENAARLSREPLPITRELLMACVSYSWPGNVRELENFVKKYLIVRDQQKLIEQLHPGKGTAFYAPEGAASAFSMRATDLKSLVRALKEQAERQAILGALQLMNGNRKAAAGILKISLRALLYKIREYQIQTNKLPDA